MSAESILQAVRAALKLALSLSDAQVIVAEADGVRPELPYLTVRVGSTGSRPGLPAVVDGLDGSTPTRQARALGEAVVSVQGFGADTHDWLQTFELSLTTGSVPDQLLAAGVVLLARGPVANVAALLDTAHEPRWSLDFTARHRAVGPLENPTELVSAAVDGSIRRTPDADDDPSPLTLSFTA